MSIFIEMTYLHCRVKRFALSKHHGKPNHQLVRCAALYMLYSLYFKQPCRYRSTNYYVLLSISTTGHGLRSAW